MQVYNGQDARTTLHETEFNKKVQQMQRGNAFILNDLINVYGESTLSEVFVIHARQKKGVVELWFWCKRKTSLNQLKRSSDEDLQEIIHRVYRRLIPEHYASLKPDNIQMTNTFVSYFG